MLRSTGACWRVVGAVEQLRRVHTAREVVEESHHNEEGPEEGKKMQVLRRLQEHHTPGNDVQVGVWREVPAQRRNKQRPSIVV